MSIRRIALKIRNNWKKSTFAVVVLSYGTNWALEKHHTNELMRIVCAQAAKYGQQPITTGANPRTITVILNPAANKRKASDDFDTYCAPILNLAGICVNVVKTESEGSAKDVVSELAQTDALVIAGGDGTVSEVITGLVRRTGESEAHRVPIGVIPLGKTNSVAKLLFPGGDQLARVKSMADACMAVVKEITRPMDVMRIEVLDDEHSESKPVYAMSSLEWGAYRDAHKKTDKYWYLGALRSYATYFFNGMKQDLSWECAAALRYYPPCDGCSNCCIREVAPATKKWYNKFVKTTPQPNATRLNEDCSSLRDCQIQTADLVLNSSLTGESTPKLQVRIGPNALNFIDFVRTGWGYVHGSDRPVVNTIEARQLELKPTQSKDSDKEEWFSIDKEDFEVKPVRITILPKIINMFCTETLLN